MSAEENLQRMKTLDDAWNAQDWAVFRKRHRTMNLPCRRFTAVPKSAGRTC